MASPLRARHRRVHQGSTLARHLRLGEEETRWPLALTCAPEALVVDGAAARLEQVVYNLLRNAVTYSPDGGPIRIGVARQDTAVTVAVADTGIGIPADAQGHLFESYYRASKVGPISGFGVGLHMVRAIVERHGGHIAVASVDGQGSTFTVSLPLAEPPTEAHTGLRPAPTGQGAAVAPPVSAAVTGVVHGATAAQRDGAARRRAARQASGTRTTCHATPTRSSARMMIADRSTCHRYRPPTELWLIRCTSWRGRKSSVSVTGNVSTVVSRTYAPGRAGSHARRRRATPANEVGSFGS